MNYKDQLKTPQWYSKRKEILHRDNYACTKCGNIGNLQVHHKYYDKSKFAWQYNNDALITLCNDCHYKEHFPDKKTSFFMTFTKYIDLLLNLKSHVDIRLFFKLVSLSDFDSNVVSITPKIRKEICDELEIKSQQITNSLKRLKDNNLVSGTHGTYYINYSVAFKGSLKNKITK